MFLKVIIFFGEAGLGGEAYIRGTYIWEEKHFSLQSLKFITYFFFFQTL